MNAHIVVATDGSAPAADAVRWASAEAARTRRPLRIVHVSGVWAYDRPTRSALSAIEQVGEHERNILAEAARLAREQAPGLAVDTAIVWGRVNIALQREAEHAELLVLGRHGHGLSAALRLGSAVTALAARTPCPLVVVSGKPAEPFDEIVVGYDTRSAGDLDYAFAEAERRGARLRAIHAWAPPAFSPFTGGWPPLYTQMFENAQAEARRTLQPWRDKHPRVEVIEEAVCGGAAPALNAASARADLVVVGARRAILGSVTNGVLHGARCPVVVVQAAHALAGAR
ncbi:universal stress protein [Nonomuraea sp. NPDC050310]|uniref:universal stress protein n=1 Tax=Nonomuraea sp. NPDC050310 TaxID=3154935 RepID=UPI00340F6C4F